VAEQLAPQLLVGRHAGSEDDERLDHRPGGLVGLADHAGLDDGRVFVEHRLHLERSDQVAGGLDDVVAPADEPEVAVGVASREVAGVVPAVDERSSGGSARPGRGSRGTSTAIRRGERSPRISAGSVDLDRSAVVVGGEFSVGVRPSSVASIPGTGRPIDPGRTELSTGSWRS
jgi:hypothetical protein